MEFWNVPGTLVNPKGHDKVFEEAVTGPDRCFQFFTFLDEEEVVCSLEVQFGVDPCSSQSVHSLVDEGQRVLGRGCNHV